MLLYFMFILSTHCLTLLIHVLVNVFVHWGLPLLHLVLVGGMKCASFYLTWNDPPMTLSPGVAFLKLLHTVPTLKAWQPVLYLVLVYSATSTEQPYCRMLFWHRHDVPASPCSWDMNWSFTAWWMHMLSSTQPLGWWVVYVQAFCCPQKLEKQYSKPPFKKCIHTCCILYIYIHTYTLFPYFFLEPW